MSDGFAGTYVGVDVAHYLAVLDYRPGNSRLAVSDPQFSVQCSGRGGFDMAGVLPLLTRVFHNWLQPKAGVSSSP